MAQVLRISKSGFNALTEANAYNYILTTDYPTYKIAFEGSANFTIAANTNSGQYTLNHNLGYIPTFLPFVARSGKIFQAGGSNLTSIDDVILDDGVTVCSVDIYSICDTVGLEIGAYIRFPVDGLALTNYTFTAHWKVFIDQAV